VTGQAVSKWERDECYPDITLLPGLANLFGVTVDELIGMKELTDNEKLNDVFRRMHELGSQKRYDEIIEMLEAALMIFPNRSGILSCLGTTLALAGDTSGRAIQLCEHALEECKSYKGRGSIYAELCFMYQKYGMTEKAEKLARTLPHTRESRELLLPNFLKQPERNDYLRENLPGILIAICKLIDGDNQENDEGLRSIEYGTYNEKISPADAIHKITEFLEGGYN
jgi:transcriptional regulator with XRE-family HTH domain